MSEGLGANYVADMMKEMGFGDGRQARPSEALQALSDAGFVGAVIYYSGGGDSGGTDKAFFFQIDGTKVEQNAWPDGLVYDRDHEGYTHADPDVLRDWQLLNKLERPLFDKHGSWADGGGYHAEGVLIYDVPNWAAMMKESEQITEYKESEEDLVPAYDEHLRGEDVDA